MIGNTKAAELHGVLNQWISKRQRSLLLSPKFQPEINLRSRDLNRPDPVHVLHSKGEGASARRRRNESDWQNSDAGLYVQTKVKFIVKLLLFKISLHQYF